ncbi:sensor histidine kinase [Sphingomonas oligoaromativorans]|uniref:sensor histidine kinase n=1 Tax=Sphingomonas oligoaromativorans TaxID=575322 RepID=UPI0014207B10|nr:histidine kinase [Sphingomonas oligoaromativorans]NIJ33660.1 hypothetical protein [Sphingomonas oligoaromativorans]
MQIGSEEPPPARLSPRVALMSIAGFWAFYFAITTARAVAFGYDNQFELLFRRAAVALVSMGLSYIFYLLLRGNPTASLKRTMVLAAFIAIPAAIIYSSVNLFFFHETDKKMEAKYEARYQKGAPPRRGFPMEMPPGPPDNNFQITTPVPPGPPVAAKNMTHDDEEMTILQSIAENSWNGYFFFVAWASLYVALCYAAEVGALERRTGALRAAAQAAELRALRYQVNPHFLFNTLNSLSSLVLTGRQEQAERMILNLSTFFRTSLCDDPTVDVPLSEEIHLQRLYLDIEAVRFPERLVIDIDIPERLQSACVPGLILQPLVENAVKYGVSRSKKPVTIRIRARESELGLLLCVEDDGDPLPTPIDAINGTGVGLQNVRDRLVARFGEAGSCRWGALPGGGFAVRLAMPMVWNCA